ncbi:MAG TPA: DUF4062 domain-containing protein, partial [Gemmataceae bacterium]|nr:DUF4062 domain-containing protein [Gemmataceae bacterium]
MSTPPPIIRVFLSANIPDMRAEREYLHKRLFPRIVAWYEKRGIGVELIDPARTRTEREAEDPAALKMGFAAVRECKPFFVGLIGQRYGRELNESTREAACFPRLRRVPFNSSRIHLEAILGVLDEPEQAVGGFIYVRTSDYLKQLPNALLSLFTGDHVNEVRLKYLLVELRECGRPVREYHCTWDSQGNQIAGLDTLGRLIANDFELAIHVHLYGPRSTFIPSLARELFTPRQENTPLRMSQSPRKDVAVDLGSLKPPTKDDTGLRAEEVDLGGPLVPSEHDTGVGLPSAQLPLPDSPPYVDENVQFTVYRPKVIQPAQWYQLLAFAHLSERRPDAAPDEPDPLKQVASIVQQRLGTKVKEYEGLKQDASQGVPRGDEITFVPRVTGIDFNPKRRTFHWLKSVHVEEFDMMARP